MGNHNFLNILCMLLYTNTLYLHIWHNLISFFFHKQCGKHRLNVGIIVTLTERPHNLVAQRAVSGVSFFQLCYLTSEKSEPFSSF